MIITKNPKTQTIALLRGYGPFSFGEKQCAIITAVHNASFSSCKKEPGEIIKHLPQDVRKVLKDCKSKDWYHRIK